MRSTRVPAITASISLVSSALAGGGDDAFTAIEITSLPFAVVGDTTDNTDQFDVACPFTGSTSPDAWYVYTVPREQALAIDLCDSAFDTKLYVLDTQFNDIACVDDSCSDANGNPFRSNLVTPGLEAGTVVYVVIDGYASDFGTYSLSIEGQEPPEPCVLTCPDGGIPEGEDTAGACDQTVDTNGGCNASPFAITDVSCGDTVCGIAWAEGGTRDTDWYQLPDQGVPTLITCSIQAEFEAALFFIGEDWDCSSLSLGPFVLPDPCETGTIEVVVTGETWWFVAASDFFFLPCGVDDPLGNDYVISWSCTTDLPPLPCPSLGDVNVDGLVDFNDLLTVLANFGPCP